MKMRKMLAVLSATAIAVTSLSISAFADLATADTGYATAPAAEDAIINAASMANSNSNATVTSKLGSDGKTLEVTVKVKEKVTTDVAPGNVDSNGQQPKNAILIKLAYKDAASAGHVYVNGYTPEAASVLRDDGIYLWVDGNKAFETDTNNQVKHYWLYQFQKAITVGTNKFLIDGQEKGANWKNDATKKQIVKVTYEQDTSSTVPEGYVDLGTEWNKGQSLNGKLAKAGDKIVIDFNKASAGAQIQIALNGTALPGFAALEGYNSTYKVINIAADTKKYEYTITAEDVALIAAAANDDARWIYVSGQNAVIKATLTDATQPSETTTPGGSENPPATKTTVVELNEDKVFGAWEVYTFTHDVTADDVISITYKDKTADNSTDWSCILIKSNSTEAAQTLYTANVQGSLSEASGTFTYKLTAADITALNGGKLVVQGNKVTITKIVINPDATPGEETTAAPAEPNTPNIRPVAPSGASTEAPVTTAAPEVVTAANGESVEAPKDVIPSGAVLEVKEQPKEEAVKAVEAIKATDENKEVVDTVKKAVEDDKAAVLDINLVKDGAKVQPDGTIKVTINIPTTLKDAANLFVYRVEADGKLTDVKASVVNGKLVFSTSHFSTYIITSEALTGDAVVTEATEAPAATTAATTAPEKTDDKNQATGVVLAVIPAVIAAAGVVVSKKRK